MAALAALAGVLPPRREARGVASLIVVIVVVGGTWLVVSFVRRRRWGLEARRGLSIGADLGMLRDTPKVTVRAVEPAGPDSVRVIFTPQPSGEGGAAAPEPPELDLRVSLTEGDSGFELLRQWQQAGTTVAIVMPADSHIVRLRSVEDLQPLTLRRIDAPG